MFLFNTSSAKRISVGRGMKDSPFVEEMFEGCESVSVGDAGVEGGDMHGKQILGLETFVMVDSFNQVECVGTVFQNGR